jgi:hypothetical protein
VVEELEVAQDQLQQEQDKQTLVVAVEVEIEHVLLEQQVVQES